MVNIFSSSIAFRSFTSTIDFFCHNFIFYLNSSLSMTFISHSSPINVHHNELTSFIKFHFSCVHFSNDSSSLNGSICHQHFYRCFFIFSRLIFFNISLITSFSSTIDLLLFPSVKEDFVSFSFQQINILL